MANIINADTSNGLKLTSDTSGEIKLQSAGADIATVSSTGIAMAAGKTLPAAALTGTLPALDASSLTNIPAANLTGSLPAGMGGKILQVVSTTKTNTFSTSSTSYTDVTGLSASITPSSTSSKILVIVNVLGSQDVNVNRLFMKLLRDSTSICIGDSSGSRDRVSFGSSSYESVFMTTWSQNYLDSPSTTSATTYKIQMRVSASTGYINRADDDTDSSIHQRGASTITLMEVGA